MDYKEKKQLEEEKQRLVDKFRESLSGGLYTESEIEVIKGTFYDNEELLTALRNFFFQLELTEKEQDIISSFAKTDAYNVLYKTFIPELDPNMPISNNVDLWVGVNTKEKLPEDSVLEMKSREIVIKYLQEQFNRLLKGGDFGDIKLSELTYVKSKNSEEAYIDLHARNSILGQVSGNLMNLRNIAFQEKTQMSQDEIQKMMGMNSNQ